MGAEGSGPSESALHVLLCGLERTGSDGGVERGEQSRGDCAASARSQGELPERRSSRTGSSRIVWVSSSPCCFFSGTITGPAALSSFRWNAAWMFRLSF